MAEQTSASIQIEASPAAVMRQIADFDSYPQWATAVKSAQVVREGSGGRAEQVHFELNAGPIKDSYVLAYQWDDDRSVSWTLVEGQQLKKLDGSYTLRDRGRGITEVTYHLTVDVSIPMIGPLKRKAEKMIIDTALKELKRQLESTAGS